MNLLKAVASLHNQLLAAGIPVITVRRTASGFEILYAPEATQQQIDDGDAILAAFDGTDVTQEAREVVESREFAVANFLVTKDFAARLARAIAIVAKTELNILRRQVIAVATATWNPASIGNNAGLTSPNLNVPGANFGDFVCVAAPYSLQGLTATAYVSAADTVQVRLQNTTGAAVDLASGDWKVVVWRPEEMDPRTNDGVKTAISNQLGLPASD